MSFAVMIHEKGGQPRRQEFDKNEVTIGRVQGNDIILPKQNVSKRHSRIVIKDGKFIIVDLKSTNGTYVNGRKIASPMVIKETDKIYIGDFILSAEPMTGGSEKAAPPEPAVDRKPPPPPPRPKPVSKPQAPEPVAAPEPPSPRREPSPPPVHEEPVAPPPTMKKPEPAQPQTPPPVVEAAKAPTASPSAPAASAAPAYNGPVSVGQLYDWVVNEARRQGMNPPVAYPQDSSIDEDAMAALKSAAATALGEGDSKEHENTASDVIDEVFNLGALGGFIQDDSVESIFANGPSDIWVTRNGKRELSEQKLSGVDALLSCVSRIFNGVGATLDTRAGFAQSYTADGARVHLALSGSGGPYLTIDCPTKRCKTMKELVKADMLSENMASFLQSAFELGRNIVVASNEIESRFDLIAALLEAAPEGCRIVSAESGGRLPRRPGHVILSGSSAGSEASLVSQAMKMTPDRLIVPDCAGMEVLRALSAFGGAVEGGVIGVDAESPEDALIRLSRQAGLGVIADTAQVEAMVTDRADVLVQILNYTEGGPRVSQIMDLDGEVREIFTGFETFAGAGYIPRWYENAHIVGHKLDQDIFN